MLAKKKNHWLAASFIGVTSLIGTQQVTAAEADEETIKQISRQISSVITQKLGQELVSTQFVDQPSAEKLNGFWSTGSYTSIEFDSDFEIDIYQVTGGVDHKYGNLSAGVSVTYARAEAGLFKSNQVSFTPYASYKFSKNIFLAALGGYVRNEGVGRRNPNSDTAIMDISMNGVFPVYQQLFFKPKVGYRFVYSVIDLNLPDDDSVVHTYYAQGELSYNIDNIQPYFNTLYERSDPDNGGSDDSVFISAGVNYKVNDDLTFGVGYRHQINKSKIDYHQALAEVRLAF